METGCERADPGSGPSCPWKASVKNPQFLVGAEDVAIGDVNEDGCPDLAGRRLRQGRADSLSGGLLRGELERVAGRRPAHAKNPAPDDDNEAGWANQVRLTDINKDGHLDIVASYYKGPRVWLGDGKGHWKPSSAGLPEPTIYGLYRGIAVADVNEDGLPDIVAASQANGTRSLPSKA